MTPIKSTNQSKVPSDIMHSLGLFIGCGGEFVAILGTLCYIGYRLDIYLHTCPWMLVLFFLIGFAASLYRIKFLAQVFDRYSSAKKCPSKPNAKSRILT